jgi:hypothetical protein
MRNTELSAEADRRAAAFFASASTVVKAAAPLRLLDEAVGTLCGNLVSPRSVLRTSRRNPFALLAVALGAWMVFRELRHDEHIDTPKNRRGRRNERAPRLKQEGENHGYNTQSNRH